ncbi:MAG: hypothetical protein ACLQUY_07650 [Ktedonobacterales bacterium]
MDDARARAEVAAEVKLLRQQEEKLEAERVATLAHYADWREQQEGFQQTLDWCARVGANLDSFTYDERRASLTERHLSVLAWYGVRVFTDIAADDAPLPDPEQLLLVLACEEWAGRTDPYRQVAALLHVIATSP